MEFKKYMRSCGNKLVEGSWVELPEDDPLYEERAYTGTLHPLGDSSFLHRERVGRYKYRYDGFGIGGVSFGYEGHTNDNRLRFSDVYHTKRIPGKTAKARKKWLIDNRFIKE